jgi:hypothetical protein
MEKTFTQRFSYTRIALFKNYSNIPERNTYYLPTEHEYVIPNKIKKNRQYFKSKYGNVGLILNQAGEFFTTKDRQIKKHYNNPFSEINVHLIERKIKITDDKIIVSLYRLTKNRRVNLIYFKKSVQIHRLIINRKNGDITTYFNGSNGGVFRKNCFTVALNVIQTIFDFGKTYSSLSNVTKNISKEIEKVFDDFLFYKEFYETIGIKHNIVKHTRHKLTMDFLVNDFVNKKNIKIPDNYHNLIINFYPTEKFLKKNDRKLIASILDMFGIKSKVTIKILHENPKIDIYNFIDLCTLLGENFHKYISSVNLDAFSSATFIDNDKYTIGRHLPNTKELSKSLTNKDKETIVSLINSKVESKKFNLVTVDISFMNLLKDHISMLKNLREYYPDYVLRCTHTSYFDEEHRNMTMLISKIKKGTTVKYEFNQDMLSEIEKPIELKFQIDDNIVTDYLYPTILKTEEDYIEEGSFMHHCVATYSEKEKSIIVSIRTKDGKDRVTCEFECQNGNLIQSRHFCNQDPPADFMIAVDELKNKTRFFAKRGMLHSISKIKTPIVINGIEVPVPKISPTQEIFDRLMNLPI